MLAHPANPDEFGNLKSNLLTGKNKSLHQRRYDWTPPNKLPIFYYLLTRKGIEKE